MQKKEIIKSLIREFHHRPLPKYTAREIAIPLKVEKIITLIGARRSGKTFLLYQLIDRLLRETDKTNLIFLNFEDERLGLVIQEADLILQAYRELYPGRDMASCYFFFDEIQNLPGWERFVRRLYDTVSTHIFLTGSNARLLSSEISTSLRGRSISYEVFPLSFREYLSFRGITVDFYIPETKGAIYNALESYLEFGGFPELVSIADDEVRSRILQEYFDVMLFRDLVERYEIKNLIALKFFIKRLFSSATKQVSIHRIYNDLKSAGIRIGKNSLYDFLEQAEAIFLVQTLKKYSPKVSVQEFGERKIFIIDNGLLNSVVFKFSADRGKAMEQVVFWELRRRGKQFYFLKNGYECDFITVSRSGMITDVIQVCSDLSDPLTLSREMKGIRKTCKRLGKSQGTIITYDQENKIKEDGVITNLIPLPVFISQDYST
ncbi:MAG: ATP-binding protein [Deltaproteobacteria bacterium]|nr:ATP-binding protein [Deltaproteobacteria bacterium]